MQAWLSLNPREGEQYGRLWFCHKNTVKFSVLIPCFHACVLWVHWWITVHVFICVWVHGCTRVCRDLRLISRVFLYWALPYTLGQDISPNSKLLFWVSLSTLLAGRDYRQAAIATWLLCGVWESTIRPHTGSPLTCQTLSLAHSCCFIAVQIFYKWGWA